MALAVGTGEESVTSVTFDDPGGALVLTAKTAPGREQQILDVIDCFRTAGPSKGGRIKTDVLPQLRAIRADSERNSID